MTKPTYQVENGVLVKVFGWTKIHAVTARSYKSSDGFTVYTTWKWQDGTYSCNCPGWTKGSKSDRNKGDRDCKHMKMLKRDVPSDVAGMPLALAEPAAKQTTSVMTQPKPRRLIGGEV